MSSNSIASSTFKGERSGKEGSVFLMTCKTSSTDMLVNRLTTLKLSKGSLPFENWYPCINFMKYSESFTKASVLPTYGETLLGDNRGQSIELTIGLRGVPGLCISGSP
jgi:hypothetical protein